MLHSLKQTWLSNIRGDILAGLVVALALIPEAIAFSIIAGVDPKVALCAALYAGLHPKEIRHGSRRQAAGFNQAALDEAARRGFGNGAFEDSEEDASAIVEEFYPEGEAPAAATISQLNPTKPSLAEKLDAQAARHTPPTDQDQGGRHAPAQAESQ